MKLLAKFMSISYKHLPYITKHIVLVKPLKYTQV
jgi:hypothetical protein